MKRTGARWTYSESMAPSCKSAGLTVHRRLHLRHLNPLPRDLAEVLRRHPQVAVLENNSGQLWRHLRASCLLDLKRLGKVQGTAFHVPEIIAYAESLLETPA